METTQQYYKTGFNYFAPFDFETYKKIKRIKAVRNISEIRAARYKKWARKLPKNRKTKAPIFCELFYTPDSYMDDYITLDKKTFKWVKVNFKVEYAKKTELNELILELWIYAIAKPSEKDVGPEPKQFETLNIDKLYDECEEFYRLYYKR